MGIDTENNPSKLQIIFNSEKSIMKERGMSMMQALDAIYNSDTYSSLINLKSGLYSQSTAYVYEYLDNELRTGTMQ